MIGDGMGEELRKQYESIRDFLLHRWTTETNPNEVNRLWEEYQEVSQKLTLG